MTQQEKVEILHKYCDCHDCDFSEYFNKHPVCKFDKQEDRWCMLVDPESPKSEKKINDAYSKIQPETVNHPDHYNRPESMECIDEMILIFGREATRNFCLLNVWKYRYRAADKNGMEDLKKSDWYMRKYKELCEYEGVPIEDIHGVLGERRL